MKDIKCKFCKCESVLTYHFDYCSLTCASAIVKDLQAQVAELESVINGRNAEIDNLTKTIDKQHNLLQDLRNKPLQVWACDICGGRTHYRMKPLVSAICPNCLTAPAKWHKEGE